MTLNSKRRDFIIKLSPLFTDSSYLVGGECFILAEGWLSLNVTQKKIERF